MTDKKNELTTDVLLADIMLRLTAMEKLLIEKKSFTQEELSKATEEIAQRVAKVVLEKAQIIAFCNAFHGANEFEVAENYARAWYD